MSKFNYLAKRYIVPATAKGTGPRTIFDIETDALLDTAATVHCVVVVDLDNGRIDEYGPGQIAAALERLGRAAYLTGHNISSFDLPVLRRLHGWTPPNNCRVLDTLVASRLILPHLGELDDRAAAMGDPRLGKLRGRHSLEAWGARLGLPKTGADIEDFSAWTPELQARCVSDVAINKALWELLQPDGYPPEAMELEHRIAVICERITADGVPFDAPAAEYLCQAWKARRAELAAQLQEHSPGVNLNSRKQIGALLEARGWKPTKRTEKTKQPKIDDELLEMLPELYPEFTGLAEHYILGRRLGSLANGKEAWMKHVSVDGRIHGKLTHIGTPHSRAAHSKPNLAGVPNPKKGTPLGNECRALFHAPAGWVFVATDQANLQDRGLAHYLAPLDDGAFAKAFLSGEDQHWKNAAALSLVADGTPRDKQSSLHTALREGAKRFRYANLYGCGNEKSGQIIYDTVRIAQRTDNACGLQQLIFGNPQQPGTAKLKQIGGRSKTKFEAATPGLRKLRSRLGAAVQKNGWLPGLDGRRVPVSAQHVALNYIVTSSEAIICKQWLMRVHDELCERFEYGWDGNVVLVLWVHDELVCCCRAEIAEQVGEIMVRHAIAAGEFYQFRVPLAAEFKIGQRWAEGAAPQPIPTIEIPSAAILQAAEPTPPETIAPPPSLPPPSPNPPAGTGGNGSAKPQTFNGDLNRLPAPLAHLTQRSIWLCWRWVWNGKKWTKEPFRADAPAIHASTSDPKTWGDYATALKQVLAGKADGPGFAVRDSGIGGVDIDHCRDPVTGAIAIWAQGYLDRFPTAYREATVSGTGLRVLGTSDRQNFAPKFKLPHKGNGAAVELFSGSNHYLTLSCNEVGHCQALPSIGLQMAAIAAELGNAGRKEALDETTADDASEELPWSETNELRLRSALACIPTDETLLTEELGNSHSVWVKVGMAIERLGWGERGYAAFRDWSSRNAEKFDEKGLQTQWRSFHRNRNSRKNPVTIRTVFYYACKFGWSDEQEAEAESGAAVNEPQNPKPAEPNPAGNGSDPSAQIKSTPAKKRTYTLINLATVRPEATNWSWYGHLARGELELLSGLPKLGKSQIQCQYIACFTTGKAWPNGEPGCAPCNVIMVTAEDSLQRTIVPRLMAAGADLSRVEYLKAIRRNNRDEMFLLTEDLRTLEEMIRDVGNVGAVLLDPITAYMGSNKHFDSHRTTDVRSQLNPLKLLAEAAGVVFSAVTHPPKTASGQPLNQFIGSQAFIAAARIGHLCVEEMLQEVGGDATPTGRVLFLNPANNLAAMQPTLAYRVEVVEVVRDDGVILKPVAIRWEGETETTAKEALAAMKPGKGGKGISAQQFLLDIVTGGPVLVTVITERGAERGFSYDQLKRAKKKLGLKGFKERGEGLLSPWLWSLPQHVPADSEPEQD